MEWIGTGFVLTIGGVRLRVRIALEDTPDPRRIERDDGDEAAAGEPPARMRERRRYPDKTSSLN